MGSLTPFRGQQPATTDEAEATAAAIERLTIPTTSHWLQGRIAALLSHYYVANADPRLMEAIAEDWYAVLSKYPAWAIYNACVWWLSAENERHRSKPTPGEIEARVRVEMTPIFAAKIHLRRGIPQQAPEREPISQQTAEERREAARRILADVFRSEPPTIADTRPEVDG